MPPVRGNRGGASRFEEPNTNPDPEPDAPALPEPDAPAEEAAAEPATEPEPAPTGKERDDLIRKSYGEATAHVREKYQEEFDQFRVDWLKLRNVEWSPKPTVEQIAHDTIVSLAIEHGIDVTALVERIERERQEKAAAEAAEKEAEAPAEAE